MISLRSIWLILFIVITAIEGCRIGDDTEVSNEQELSEIYTLTDSVSSLMDRQSYDSALEIIGRTYENLKLYRYPLHKYSLLCFESEIMYYNALFDLGADKAREALMIAQTLPEMELYAGNAYNLLGINAEQVMPGYQAMVYFRNAWNLMPDHADASYSKLAHIISNLGQIEMKEGMIDSAQVHLILSNRYALRDKMYRTASINFTSLAAVEVRKKDLKAAAFYLDSADKYARLSENADLRLFVLQTGAEIEAERRNYVSLLKYMEEGLQYINKQPSLPEMSILDFYANLYRILRKSNYFKESDEIRKREIALYSDIKSLERQVQDTLLKQFHINTLLLELQDKDQRKNEQIIARHKFLIQWLWVGILILVIIAGGIVAFIYQKRRSDKLEFEKERIEMKLKHELAETKAGFESELRERRRISQEFHDGIAPGLSSLKLISVVLGRKNPDDQTLKSMPGIIDQTMQDIKNLLNDINPTLLLNNGLHYAVNQYLNQMQIAYQEGNISLESNIYGKRLPNETELHLYRIIQEAVHNAVRHTRAERINVNLDGNQHTLKITVRDSGIKLSEKLPAVIGGNGMKNIEARAALIHAKLNIIHHNDGLEIQILINLPEWQEVTYA